MLILLRAFKKNSLPSAPISREHLDFSKIVAVKRGVFIFPPPRVWKSCSFRRKKRPYAAKPGENTPKENQITTKSACKYTGRRMTTTATATDPRTRSETKRNRVRRRRCRREPMSLMFALRFRNSQNCAMCAPKTSRILVFPCFNISAACFACAPSAFNV